MNRPAIRSEPWPTASPSAEEHHLDVVDISAAEATDDAFPASTRVRIAGRRRGAIVVLDVDHVWAFEARERLCFVHSAGGRFDIDLSLQELALKLGPDFSRVHRSWLVNLVNVREYRADNGHHALLVGRPGGGAPPDAIEVPVSREYSMPIRTRLLAGTVGFRRRRRTDPRYIP